MENYYYYDDDEVLNMDPGPYDSRTINTKILMYNDSEVSIDLLIDIGGVYPLYLPLGKTDNITLPEKYYETITGSGLFGPVSGYIGRIKELQLGKYAINDVLTAYTEVDSTADIYGNTMIGLPLLQRFNITFDYFNEKLIIEPSEIFNNKFDFSKTGLRLRPDPNGYLLVNEVFTGSPGDEAGIKVTDIITFVNNKKTTDYKPGEIRTILSQEGKTVTFVIESKGEKKNVVIELREIL